VIIISPATEEVKRMYCQQCGAQIGDAKFCRKCGAPSGTSGSLLPPEQLTPPDYEKGFKKFFMGLAFLIIAIFPIFTNGRFWWWMLFPAVPLLAAGIGEFARAGHVSRLRPASFASLSVEPAQMRPVQQNELPHARNTSELAPPLPPSSVTEGTTRMLDQEKVRRD
jgi:hypothetical protein